MDQFLSTVDWRCLPKIVLWVLRKLVDDFVDNEVDSFRNGAFELSFENMWVYNIKERNLKT